MLQSTKFKIAVAKTLYRILKLVGVKESQTVTRNGITYELDLSEGIDLSIFLFGGFQQYVTPTKFGKLGGDVIIDVGANIGAMSLSFAKAFEGHKIYAFEPTDYAHGKLEKNLRLNPKLAERIQPIKSFLSSESCDDPKITAYSSWKLTETPEDEVKHGVHFGSAKEASHTPAFRLDDFAKSNNLGKVGFIKIDTDGHELDVLIGAEEIIRKDKPLVVFECGLYCIAEHGQKFSDFMNRFEEWGYTLRNSKNGNELTRESYQDEFPDAGTIDVIALPKAS